MKKALILGTLCAALVLPAAAQAKRYNLTLTYGQDVLLVGDDSDISIHAQCIQNDPTFGDILRVYAKAGANSVMRGSYDYFGGNGTYLTAATAAADSEVAFIYNSTAGQELFGGAIDSGFAMNLTSRRGYTWTNETTIGGLNNGGNDCVLSINLDAIKKFKAAQ